MWMKSKRYSLVLLLLLLTSVGRADTTPTDPCQSENAQEVWYLVQEQYPSSKRKLVEKNFYYLGKENGRTLLLRQEKTSEVILLTASWYSADHKQETLPKELLQSKSFLSSKELLDFVGPFWTQHLKSRKPTLIEETFSLKKGEIVTLQNNIATTLNIQMSGRHILCEKDKACRCLSPEEK